MLIGFSYEKSINQIIEQSIIYIIWINISYTVLFQSDYLSI